MMTVYLTMLTFQDFANLSIRKHFRARRNAGNQLFLLLFWSLPLQRLQNVWKIGSLNYTQNFAPIHFHSRSCFRQLHWQEGLIIYHKNFLMHKAEGLSDSEWKGAENLFSGFSCCSYPLSDPSTLFFPSRYEFTCCPTLTLFQTSPGFYVSAVQVFRKHCGKRRNCL